MIHRWSRVVALGAAVIVAASLTACGGHSYRYPAAVQARFLRACRDVTRGSASCRCTLHHIERHVSLARFGSADRDFLADATDPPDWLRDASNACGG